MGSQVNSVILGSIPISKGLKKALELKFRWLSKHNGPAFAADTFKGIREACLRYIADRDVDELLSSPEYSHLGAHWVRRRFVEVLNTQPHDGLQLLKLYTASKEPVENRDRFANEFRELLDSIEPLPQYLTEPVGELLRDTPIGRLIDRSKVSGVESLDQLEAFLPSAEDYKLSDVDKLVYSETGTCDKLMDDAARFARIFHKDYADLPELLWDVWDISGLDYDYLVGQADRCTVGTVEMIPKTGTTTWRPIGNTNKYYQTALLPFSEYVYGILDRVDQDCRRDQAKFDSLIMQRIDNGDYVASVDLSKATEYMPVDLFYVLLKGAQMSPLQAQSFEVFKWFNQGEWRAGRGYTSWKRGQALGSVPSFGVLSITHHAILQYLCKELSLDVKDYPYVILGDDLVVFNEELRNLYVTFMKTLGSPLSLHKSYSGKLTEFAGKMYIYHNGYRYNTDHNPITWNTLFDWQAATRTRIPWDRLPGRLRRRWTRGFASKSSAKTWYDAYSYAVSLRTPPSRISTEVAQAYQDIYDILNTPRDPVSMNVKFVVLGDRVIVNTSHDVMKMPLDWYREKYRAPDSSVAHSHAVLLSQGLPISPEDRQTWIPDTVE